MNVLLYLFKFMPIKFKLLKLQGKRDRDASCILYICTRSDVLRINGYAESPAWARRLLNRRLEVWHECVQQGACWKEWWQTLAAAQNYKMAISFVCVLFQCCTSEFNMHFQRVWASLVFRTNQNVTPLNLIPVHVAHSHKLYLNSLLMKMPFVAVPNASFLFAEKKQERMQVVPLCSKVFLQWAISAVHCSPALMLGDRRKKPCHWLRKDHLPSFEWALRSATDQLLKKHLLSLLWFSKVMASYGSSSLNLRF